MSLSSVIPGLILLGMTVELSKGSQCFFVVAIDGLVRAKT